jgi:glycine oxidase
MQAETPYSASACDLSCDLLVVGGGVVGLWTARLAARRGMDVILADRGQIGGGASGGVLGALMPHMPERWNPKKQFQFEALRSLPDMIAALEAETGIATGYRRIGRLMPLSLPHHRALALERAGHVEEVWRPHGADLRWSVVERPARAGWPAAEAMAHGAVLETLTARL